MRAIAVTSFKTKPEFMDLPKPEANNAEILVRLSAAGMNPFDWKVSDGRFQGQMPNTFPLVLGFDGAGIVEATGPGVTRFEQGDPVFGQFWQMPLGRGTYAEYIAISENAPIAKIPAGLDPVQAAALPTAGMAALDLLARARLERNSNLLVIGATGGVGLFLVQAAQAQGLSVIATGRQADTANLKSLGAETVIDYTSSSVYDQVRQNHANGIDGLVDLVSNPADFSRLSELVRTGGVAITSNYVADEKALAARGLRGGNFVLGASAALAEQLGKDAASGKLAIQIEKRVAFEDALTALEEFRAGRARGKTVITI